VRRSDLFDVSNGTLSRDVHCVVFCSMFCFVLSTGCT